MKYEYRVVEFTCYDQYDLENNLASYGQRGWELCATIGGLFIFKKPKD